MTINLRFPDKATAHSLLYIDTVDEDGNPFKQRIYRDMYDGGDDDGKDHAGIPCERSTTVDENGHEVEIRILPTDGSYCANVFGLTEVPEALAPYVITVNPLYAANKCSGE